MKTYNVTLNFTEYIEAESEEAAIEELSERYNIKEKYFFAAELEEENNE